MTFVAVLFGALGLFTVGAWAAMRASSSALEARKRQIAARGMVEEGAGVALTLDGLRVHLAPVTATRQEPMGTTQRFFTRVWVDAELGDLDLRAGVVGSLYFPSILLSNTPRFQSCEPLREVVVEWPQVWAELGQVDAPLAIAEGAISLFLHQGLLDVRPEEWAPRLARIRRLVAIPASELVPRAVAVAAQDPDSGRRARALRALATRAPREALSVATNACMSRDPQEQGAGWLVRAANGEDASGWFAAHGTLDDLDSLAAASAWSTLRPILPRWWKHPEPEVATRAIRLARHAENPGPALAALVDSPHPEVVWAALDVLGTLRSAEAEEAALRALDLPPPSGPVAQAAVRVLAQVGTVRAVAPLLEHADRRGVTGELDTAARDAVLRIQSRLGPVDAGRVSMLGGGEVSVTGGGEVSEAGPPSRPPDGA